MSIEIDDKIKKAIILSIKDDFKDEDYQILDDVLDKIKKQDEYKVVELLFEKEGYEIILKNREYRRGFCSRLLFEYHEPIVQFEIIIEFCLSIFKDFEYPKEAYPKTCKVLNGIVARGVLITNEILCLIKNGFASGALARWRTLYEYSVIAVFIAKFGEDVAERYLAYEDIANFSHAETYNNYVEELGFEKIEEQEFAYLKSLSDKAKLKYPQFNNQEYSWALPEIRQPSFKALAEATDINYFRPFYRFSCNYNHGGIKGLFYDLGQLNGLDEQNSYMLASTNIGFIDPAQLTMQSLINIVAALISTNPNITNLINIVQLREKAEKATEAFVKVDKDIKDRELGRFDEDIFSLNTH